MRVGLALLLILSACTADNPNFRGPGFDGSSGDGLITHVDMAKPNVDGAVDPDLANPSMNDLAKPGLDATFNCVDEGAACQYNAATAGLCKSGLCLPCEDPEDDGLCTAAYGGDRLCIKGSCVPGNCRDSGDCVGKLCAGTLCVPCFDSDQCRNDKTYGDNSFCDTDTGLCTFDEACPPADGNVYVVDPVFGDDGKGSGNGDTDGCAFRTISQALDVLPSNPSTPTTILVRGQPGDTTSLTNGESYPLVIPNNVTVTIEDGSGDIALTPSTKFPFTLQGKNVRLGGNATARFLIDGGNAPFGEASGITTQNTTNAIVDHVRITNYDGQQGIGLQIVSGATVALGEDVEISGCGIGIRVNGRNNGGPQIGNLTVSLPDDLAGEGLFVHDNTTGLSVIGLGYATLVGDYASATIKFENNSTAGISITQTASNNLNLNTIDGVSVRGPGNAAISLQFGSRVKLRRTDTLGAMTGLVLTVPFGNVGAPDPSLIDLGTSSDPGRNTFQHPSLPNSNTGICLLAAQAPTSAVAARGNAWNALDCLVPNAGDLIVADNKGCSGGVDVGYQVVGNPDLDNVFDVANCGL